jgi:hypothetical protein
MMGRMAERNGRKTRRRASEARMREDRRAWAGRGVEARVMM